MLLLANTVQYLWNLILWEMGLCLLKDFLIILKDLKKIKNKCMVMALYTFDDDSHHHDDCTLF